MLRIERTRWEDPLLTAIGRRFRLLDFKSTPLEEFFRSGVLSPFAANEPYAFVIRAALYTAVSSTTLGVENLSLSAARHCRNKRLVTSSFGSSTR
jgi:hypothetical protein